MSDTRSSRIDAGPSGSAPPSAAPRRTRWTGWIAFAAFLMMMLGFFQAIAGLAAIFNDDYYRVTPSGLVLEVDYTVWGWVHLALGVAVFLSGLGVLSGNVVARTVGVVLAGLSALVNLAFVAAEPGWALTIIAVDVLVIYALIVHGHEMEGLL